MEMHFNEYKERLEQEEQGDDPYQHVSKQIIAMLILETGKTHQITLDTEYGPSELNQLVKELAKEDDMEDQQDQQNQAANSYGFLVESYLLLQTLKSHLVRYEISTEKTIQVKCIRTTVGQDFKSKVEHDLQEDWVAVISELSNSQGHVVVGMYNGVIDIYQCGATDPLNGKSSVASLVGPSIRLPQQDPIRSLIVIPQQQNSYAVIVGGLSERLRLVHVSASQDETSSNGKDSKKHKKSKKPQTYYEARINPEELATAGPVLVMATNPLNDYLFCAGGQKGTVFMHQYGQQSATNGMKAKKRRKGSLDKGKIEEVQQGVFDKGIRLLKEFHIGSGSQMTILAMSWLDECTIVLGGLNHSIDLMDVQSGLAAGSYPTMSTHSSITTSIDVRNGNELVSGHEDGYVRLWDVRTAGDQQLGRSTFKSHTKLCSQVKINPQDRNYMLTVRFKCTEIIGVVGMARIDQYEQISILRGRFVQFLLT